MECLSRADRTLRPFGTFEYAGVFGTRGLAAVSNATDIIEVGLRGIFSLDRLGETKDCSAELGANEVAQGAGAGNYEQGMTTWT